MILLLLCINLHAHAVRDQSAFGQGPGDIDACTRPKFGFMTTAHILVITSTEWTVIICYAYMLYNSNIKYHYCTSHTGFGYIAS